MYIRRHIEHVVERMANRKSVVVLTGARQVGKSTMLKELYPGISYVTLNRPDVRQAAIDNPSGFLGRNPSPLILDEIQRVGELFDYIKDIVDGTEKKGLFYLTGSQSLRLMRNVGDSLSGRAGIIKMLGLSMRELDGVSSYEPFIPAHANAIDALRKRPPFDYNKILGRIHKGSFPELYGASRSLTDWSDYFASYFQAYIEKDVKDLLGIRDESAFIKCVRAAAALTGQMLNYTTIAEICGKDVKTVQMWLSVLESSGLVYLLQPYFNNFSKRLVKAPKLYFMDTGLACFLLGWNTPEQLINGASWGHIFETYAFCEILKSYYNDGRIYPNVYYYRDKDKVEIDLVIEEGGVLYPVEIKTASDPDKSMVKSFKALSKVPDRSVGEGALICMGKNVLPLTESVWTLPVNLI